MISSLGVHRYVIIPTHNRPAELTTLLTSLNNQADTVIIVDNASEPPVQAKNFKISAPNLDIIVIRDDEQPPNLSRLWNVGFRAVMRLADINDEKCWDIAVFNDDAIVPHGWYDAVSAPLRTPGSTIAIACSLPNVAQPIVKLQRDGDIARRMCPWAFVLRGELKLEADESLRWWWGDTDMDWQARGAGGMMIIPGFPVVNALANSTTVGELAVQAGRDRETFMRKWGYAPW